MILDIKDMDVFYGQVHALQGVSLHVLEGEIVAVLGANGAGKTTLLRTIMGLLHPGAGTMQLFGADTQGIEPHVICAMGVGYVPEGRRVFSDLTVYENLLVGGSVHKDNEARQKQLDYVYELFPLLLERTRQMAGTLSGGEQQMLTISRALMTRPKLLLLDEPSLGLAPLIIKDIFNALQEINRNGTTILIVEQSAHLALKVAKRAYILESGRVTFEGESDRLSNSDAIKKAYLGV